MDAPVTASNKWWRVTIPDLIVSPILERRMDRWGGGHIAPCSASVPAPSSLARTIVHRPPHDHTHSCKTRGLGLLVTLVREDEGPYE